MQCREVDGNLGAMESTADFRARHHDPALMARANFNITWPICDRIFGTREA